MSNGKSYLPLAYDIFSSNCSIHHLFWLSNFDRKKKIPKILQEQKLLGIILISILGISVSLILAVLTKIILIPVVVTLFFASVISWKYREKFKEMESGKEHV